MFPEWHGGLFYSSPRARDSCFWPIVSNKSFLADEQNFQDGLRLVRGIHGTTSFRANQPRTFILGLEGLAAVGDV